MKTYARVINELFQQLEKLRFSFSPVPSKVNLLEFVIKKGLEKIKEEAENVD